MESPLSWDLTIRVIDEAIRKHTIAREEFICGGSLASVIAAALREQGLCEPYDPSTCFETWDELRDWMWMSGE